TSDGIPGSACCCAVTPHRDYPPLAFRSLSVVLSLRSRSGPLCSHCTSLRVDCTFTPGSRQVRSCFGGHCEWLPSCSNAVSRLTDDLRDFCLQEETRIAHDQSPVTVEQSRLSHRHLACSLESATRTCSLEARSRAFPRSGSGPSLTTGDEGATP